MEGTGWLRTGSQVQPQGPNHVGQRYTSLSSQPPNETVRDFLTRLRQNLGSPTVYEDFYPVVVPGAGADAAWESEEPLPIRQHPLALLVLARPAQTLRIHSGLGQCSSVRRMSRAGLECGVKPGLWLPTPGHLLLPWNLGELPGVATNGPPGRRGQRSAPPHNRCVGIGKNPFLGWKTLILGPGVHRHPCPYRGHGAVSSTSWASRPCFQDVGVQRNSGPHPTTGALRTPREGSRPQVPSLFLSPSSCPARLAPLTSLTPNATAAQLILPHA